MAAPLAEAEPQATSIGPPLPLADPEAGESARYFNIGEVDTPAVPRPDWEVDVALLMGMGVRSFSIDVLINEMGTAEQCAVTRIEPDQSNELRHAVAAKFCETVLSPAKRRGVDRGHAIRDGPAVKPERAAIPAGGYIQRPRPEARPGLVCAGWSKGNALGAGESYGGAGGGGHSSRRPGARNC